MGLQNLLLAADRLSSLVGKAGAWLVVALTGAICYEVFARYFFRAPTTWAFDVSYMLYGSLFMLAGAYALSRGGHVRADFAYRLMPPRRQGLVDLVCYVLFFVPAMLALVVYGWDFFAISYFQNEQSSFSPQGPLIWPFKFVIPAMGVLMLVQGAAEMVRCWIAIRTDRWPDRLSDVEELEVLTMKRAAMLRAEGDSHP